MKTITVALAFGLALTAMAPPATGLAQEPDYSALWEAGQSYDRFRQQVTARRSLWQRNTERAHVAEDVLARARAVPGRWKLLVVAFDRCSDSVSTLPYIAELVGGVAGLELRIIPPDVGQQVMAAHPTPDGRAATPTVLLLDDDWQPAGAWVERPSELQSWYIANPDNLSHDDRYFEKMAWYDRDAGASTIAEVVELLETVGS